MTPTISAAALGRRYRGQTALDNVSLDGRAWHGHRAARPQRRGQDHADAHHHRAGIPDHRIGPGVRAGPGGERRGPAPPGVRARGPNLSGQPRVSQAIRVASWFFPNWDEDLAQRLVGRLRPATSGGSGNCPAACGQRSAS